ncbi:MAG: hypothetical protein ACE5F1_04025 [Planctomycetota bacterium]
MPTESRSWTRPPFFGLLLLIPFLVSFLVFWPVLSGSFQFDDWTFGYFLDKEDPQGRVAWSEVLADFHRPQFGIEGWVYYRPLITLNYALGAALGGVTPAHLHFMNLLYHAIASVFCGLMCGALCPSRPRTALLLGGLYFAVHPIAVEPVSWISAVTGVIEIMFRFGSLAAFAVHLRGAGKLSLGLSLLCACLTLMSKETGVVLPVSLVALDLLHSRPFCFRELLRRQLAFVPIWLSYLGVRLVFLGKLVGGSTFGSGTFISELWNTLGGQIHALFLPFGGPLPGGWAMWLSVGLLAFALIRGASSRRRAFFLILGLAWIFLHFPPNFINPVREHLGGSRALHGTVGSLALLLCLLLLRDDERKEPSFHSRSGIALFAIGVLCLLPVTRARLGSYQEAWAEIKRVHAGLLELGPSSTVEKPLALVMVPHFHEGVPVFNQNAAFPMLEIPYSPRDYPLLGLNFVLVKLVTSPDLYQDASPLRALAEQGSALLYWGMGRDGGFRVDRIAEPGELPALRRVAAATFRFDRGADPYHVEALDLRVEGPARGGSLRWLGVASGAMDFGGGTADGGQTLFRIDLSHQLSYLANHIAGGIDGFEIELEGTGARISSLEVRRRVSELPLPRLLRDSAFPIGQEERHLSAPELAPEQAELELRLVLLAPTEGRALPVQAGRPVRFPPAWRTELRRILKLSRQARFYYYFEARSPEGRAIDAARSPIDWFRLRRR